MTKTEEILRATLAKRIVLLDGAMGTMLYAKGVFINRCSASKWSLLPATCSVSACSTRSRSSGCTATAVSPSIVSGRVVATVRCPEPSSSG